MLSYDRLNDFQFRLFLRIPISPRTKGERDAP